jgi:hypothetical protein
MPRELPVTIATFPVSDDDMIISLSCKRLGSGLVRHALDEPIGING